MTSQHKNLEYWHNITCSTWFIGIYWVFCYRNVCIKKQTVLMYFLLDRITVDILLHSTPKKSIIFMFFFSSFINKLFSIFCFHLIDCSLEYHIIDTHGKLLVSSLIKSQNSAFVCVCLDFESDVFKFKSCHLLNWTFNIW